MNRLILDSKDAVKISGIDPKFYTDYNIFSPYTALFVYKQCYIFLHSDRKCGLALLTSPEDLEDEIIDISDYYKDKEAAILLFVGRLRSYFSTTSEYLEALCTSRKLIASYLIRIDY